MDEAERERLADPEAGGGDHLANGHAIGNGKDSPPESPSPPPLPTSAAAAENELAAFVPAAAAWVFISTGLITSNKFLFSGSFSYPLTLASIHMSFAVVACTLLARTGLLNVPRPPPGGYRKAVVPLGVMYAATIALSNSAAKRLSIGAVQMTRSASPVFAYFLSVLWGTEPFSGAQLAVVAGISLGVALATWSEFRADRLGMAFQLAVMVVGNARTVLVRRFLENGLLPTDDALPLLALLAPATLACLAPTALYFEPGALSALASGAVGLPGLAANTLLSFVLNLAMVNMITRRGGALYLGLTMIARDFILILISVAVFAGPFRYLQALGYTIALGFVMVLTNLRGMAKRRGADGGMVTLKEAVAETVRGREIMSVPLTAAGLAVIAAFSDVAVAKAA